MDTGQIRYFNKPGPFIAPTPLRYMLAREVIKIRADLPIILCTGFSDHVDDRQARAVGIKSILLKPVVATEIAEAVRKALNEKDTH